MEQIYFKEIFQYPVGEFTDHLKNKSNERIIFSGKYGVGKTKFLSDFFSDSNQLELFSEKKYEVYRLFPTNYSIASNEDILRYIKYDIIIEMLKSSITLEEIKLKLLDTFPFYLKDNIHKVTAGIVSMIPKLGKEIVDCFDRIDKLKEQYLEQHDKLNTTDGDRLVKYLESVEQREGSIYESDITTTIISETISKNEGKESVLIIDDVDRLDPEHVFRILNVFASHFDANLISGNKNKFNFDKIIIVCDFNNIRNIFHHRYGNEVDFMGYIDKFYSSEIYHFDNKKAIQGIIKKVFESIDFQPKDSETEYALRQFYFANGFLNDLVLLLITQGFISLRNVLKLYSKKIGYQFEKVNFDSRNYDVISWKIPIMMQLKLLRDFFGDYQHMKKVFDRFVIDEEFFETHNNRMGELIYLLSYKIHNLFPRKDYVFRFHGSPIVVAAKTRANGQFETANFFELQLEENEEEKPSRGDYLYFSDVKFMEAFNDTLHFLHKIGYLK